MIKTQAIKLINPEPMMVTWDIGRRCNYDCTYCEATRHNNTSKHRTVEELKTTFNFIQRWTKLYNEQRNMLTTNINFTGGEPTSNPHFFDFIDYVKQFAEYNLSLTTNGAWNKKLTSKIIKNFSGVTVSYHAEAHNTLKKQVLENIIALHASGIWLQVNVMLHVDFWNEAVGVCNQLDILGIKYNPRPIGDGNITRKGWFSDSDGVMRRTSHEYTPEQIAWFYRKMGVSTPTTESKAGTDIGRTCCGRRCTTGKVDGEWQPVKLIDTQFKGWSCMVDHYFLHIDQETDTVYHHQTCQALHGNKRGPLGVLKNADQLIADLKIRLQHDESIVCPNTRCGCGMCVPKAEDVKDFIQIKKEFLTQETFL
jgi:MoaA/NifB/PqqE/SkfB family radical SAM enzyme